MQNMNIDDIIDSIITNIEKDWSPAMSSNIPQEKWEEPKYSKKQIETAGKMIYDPNIESKKRWEAIEILNNWRAAHAYPLQVIASNLRLNNKNAIVVQRLKRLDSIIGKLERYPNMSLYRMGDLGGCRVIVDSIDDVYKSVNKYKSSRIRHILKRETDYIQTPKLSGYRSYHLIYQFYSDKKQTYNKNMLIEIQFRTKLQHIWATAIEMMGIYTKTALKSSIGDENILRFFVLVSSVFAKMENTSICPGTPDDYNKLIAEIKEIDSYTNVISCLSALSTVVNYVNKSEKYKNASYYILLLNYEQGNLKIRQFKQSQIELATKIYNQIEAQRSPFIDTVLVSATSFDTLKAAYPNYFTDISEFVETMRRILS